MKTLHAAAMIACTVLLSGCFSTEAETAMSFSGRKIRFTDVMPNWTFEYPEEWKGTVYVDESAPGHVAMGGADFFDGKININGLNPFMAQETMDKRPRMIRSEQRSDGYYVYVFEEDEADCTTRRAFVWEGDDRPSVHHPGFHIFGPCINEDSPHLQPFDDIVNSVQITR